MWTQSESFREVAVDDSLMYALEARVVAHTANVLDTGSHEDFTDFLLRGGTPHAYVWCAETGETVGYLALSILNDVESVEVRSIAVDPSHQRTGYGKKMMRYAEQIALENSKNEIRLVTHPDNSQALKFYTVLGYAIIKTIENYYGDNTPRIILSKHLDSDCGDKS